MFGPEAPHLGHEDAGLPTAMSSITTSSIDLPLRRSVERTCDDLAMLMLAVVGVIASLTFRDYGLGWDAPWYIVKLFAVGYAPLPLLVIGLAWLAVAGQLAALAADRYAPYPAPGERPRRGPVRELIRTLVFAPRRRTAVAETRRAVNQ